MVFVESRGSLLSSCICHKLQNHSSILLLSYSSHVYISIAECAYANVGATEQCEKEQQKKNQHHQPTTRHVLSRFYNIKFLPLVSLQWGTLVSFLASTRFPPSW